MQGNTKITLNILHTNTHNVFVICDTNATHVNRKNIFKKAAIYWVSISKH